MQVAPLMVEYTATQTFRLSSNPELRISAGTRLLFDGVNIQIDGMPARPLPQANGAIKQGWLVPSGDYIPGEVRRVSAGITTRPADGGNPMEARQRSTMATAQAEETYVGSVSNHAAQVRDRNGRRVMATEVEPQDGIPVRRLGNPDGRKNPVDVFAQGSSAIAQAEKTQVRPGRGRTREEVMQNMSPEQRAHYEQEILARKAAKGIDISVVEGLETQGTVVAQVRPQPSQVTREGISTVNSVGGGIDAVDLGGTGSQQEVTYVEREGIRFQETNGPKKDRPQVTPTRVVAETDPRRIIAKAVCPDFPDIYDFDASVRKKIARVQADFEDRPDVIRAIAAAETDVEMKRRLVEEFPEAFQ